MDCPNHIYVSEKISSCKILQEDFDIKYIPSPSRSGGPCLRCKKEWDIPPDKDNLTGTMLAIIKTNGKIELPTIVEQAKSLTQSLFNWVGNGFKNVPEGEYNLRVSICKSNLCNLYSEEEDRCLACGCFIQNGTLRYGKASFSGEECPSQKWPKLPLEVINNAPKSGCGSCGKR